MREEYQWNDENGKYVKGDKEMSDGEWDKFVSWCKGRWKGWIPDKMSVKLWERWREESEE